HAFQLRVMVMKTARASATTRRGVTYFFHPTLLREAAAGLSLSTGNAFVTGAADSAGTGEADITFAPSAARDLQTLRHSWLWARGKFRCVRCASIVMLFRRSMCRKFGALNC